VQGGQVALVNMGPQPLRASAVEHALAAGTPPGEAAAHAAEGTSPPTDLNGTRPTARTWPGSWSAGPWPRQPPATEPPH
jgi:hypothetical protein